MRIILASNNAHKAEELGRIFQGHRILRPEELGLSFDHEETGETYLANALGKARALHRLLRAGGREQLPVLSDDSGLSVNALDGAPGVRSARFGPPPEAEGWDDRQRYLYLLSRMEGVTERTAFFVCCMVLMFGEYRFSVSQETFEGHIARAPSGGGGFGYDPVFVEEGTGRTVAELTNRQKDRLSHRGRAARRILAQLQGG